VQSIKPKFTLQQFADPRKSIGHTVKDLSFQVEKSQPTQLLELLTRMRLIESRRFSHCHHTATPDIRRVASMAKEVFWAFLFRRITHHVSHTARDYPLPSEIEENSSWLVPDVRKGEQLPPLSTGSKIEIPLPKLRHVKAVIDDPKLKVS
jgi:hypothetical protein